MRWKTNTSQGFRRTLTRDYKPFLGIAMLVLAIGVLIAGYLYLYGFTIDVEAAVKDLYVSVAGTLIGITVTVLILDVLNDRRSARDLLEKLTRDLASTDPSFVARAAKELRARGWLTDGCLVGADLDGADLRNADLSNAFLGGARLVKANVAGVYAKGIVLSGATALHANCQNAVFIDGDLSHADLRDSDLREADLTGAQLTSAQLDGADLRGASVTASQLKTAASIRGTRLSALLADELPPDRGAVRE